MKNLCKKCTIDPYCCYHSAIVYSNDNKPYNIIIKNQPCKYLNLKNNKCLIYKNRFKLNPYCMPIKDAIRACGLPKECLYVKDNKEYQINIPKLDYIPNDITKECKEALLIVEKMNSQEFRKRYLPLIL